MLVILVCFRLVFVDYVGAYVFHVCLLFIESGCCLCCLLCGVVGNYYVCLICNECS